MRWLMRLLFEEFPPLNERAQGWLRSELARGTLGEFFSFEAPELPSGDLDASSEPADDPG